MRFLFLCGSLEPGKDGVGDYTRRLVGELKRNGYDSRIIALNDYFIPDDTINEQEQIDTEVVIKTLRLSASISWKRRLAEAKKSISDFDPDWLSFQYVPFAFHHKGLPFSLISHLKKIGKELKWHIMFHELWVGIEDSASVKMKLWGWIQKRIVLHTIHSLKPQVIHTQTLLYKKLLNTAGFSVTVLPLFGNIPILSKVKRNDVHLLQFVIFGTIHPGASIENFAQEIASITYTNKPKIVFSFIGRNGAEQGKWVQACIRTGLSYNILNEQPEEKISEILLHSDFGITSNPLLLAPKSGTVAAMIEHGLPVISISAKWEKKQYRNIAIDTPGLYQYSPGHLSEIIITAKDQFIAPESNRLAKVAQQFVSDLQKSES